MRLLREGLDVPEEAFDPEAPKAADGVRWLAAGVSSAACVPDLAGLHPAVIASRSAAVHVASEWLPRTRIGELLGVRRNAVRKLAARPRDAALCDAVRRQLHLRSYLPARLAGDLQE